MGRASSMPVGAACVMMSPYEGEKEKGEGPPLNRIMKEQTLNHLEH